MSQASSTRGDRRPGAGDGGRAVRVLVLALAVGAVAAVRTPAARPVEEHRLKAELVERFTRFVEWPAAAGPSADEDFVLGILGEDPFLGALDEIARDRRVRGHRIRVRRLDLGDDLERCCHLLFVAAPAVERLETVLDRVGSRPVLTVADEPGAAERGVVINLVRKEDRVAFEVNVTAAARSGLEVSSKLLRLARVVGRDGE